MGAQTYASACRPAVYAVCTDYKVGFTCQNLKNNNNSHNHNRRRLATDWNILMYLINNEDHSLWWGKCSFMHTLISINNGKSETKILHCNWKTDMYVVRNWERFQNSMTTIGFDGTMGKPTHLHFFGEETDQQSQVVKWLKAQWIFLVNQLLMYVYYIYTLVVIEHPQWVSCYVSLHYNSMKTRSYSVVAPCLKGINILSQILF